MEKIRDDHVNFIINIQCLPNYDILEKLLEYTGMEVFNQCILLYCEFLTKDIKNVLMRSMNAVYKSVLLMYSNNKVPSGLACIEEYLKSFRQ